MHDLKGLMAHLVFNGVEIVEWSGALFKTKQGDVWGMAHDEYFKNDEVISRKQIRLDYPKRKV